MTIRACPLCGTEIFTCCWHAEQGLLKAVVMSRARAIQLMSKRIEEAEVKLEIQRDQLVRLQKPEPGDIQEE